MLLFLMVTVYVTQYNMLRGNWYREFTSAWQPAKQTVDSQSNKNNFYEIGALTM
jgi:hypothetical protein